VQVSAPHRISPPSNSFRVGKLTLNRRKGTAKLTIFIPGPGKMTLAGAGLLRQATESKKRRKLAHQGKIKVTAKLTFLPTGGTARTKKKKIVLRMRRHA
jgi:hypothetical protein